MIVLIDADILIDFALDREPYSAAAADVLDAAERRMFVAFVAWHTIANFYYLVRPRRGHEAARAFVLDLLRFAGVAETSTQSVRRAASLPMRDFEDALQAAAAQACGADAIATRNTRDYARSPVRAVTPTVLLKQLAL